MDTRTLFKYPDTVQTLHRHLTSTESDTCYSYVCARNIAHHIPHIFQEYILGMYVHICATYEVNGMNHMTTNTGDIIQKYFSYYWQISLHTYGSYIVNIGYTVLILYCFIFPTMVYKLLKQNQTQHLLHILLPYTVVKQI